MWFVFAGMGTQWHGMGRDLMPLECFRKSIMNSDNVLRKFGIHLYDVLMHGDERVFDLTLNSFVAIAAIQVRLMKLLYTNAWGSKNTFFSNTFFMKNVLVKK